MALRPDEVAPATRERQHERALAALARRGRLRTLAPRAGIDFTSNDYLGLATSGQLAAAAREALDRGVPPGAGGSRLLRGNHEEHEALEIEAAGFFHAQSALYFGSGFAANAALMATLPARGDLIVHDALIHASAWEGMALTKAETRSAAHNDAQAFEDAIAGWRMAGGTGRVWIAVETLYSMDGDLAPLADLAQVAARHDAMLLIDEAHATGVLGPGGRGLGAAYEGLDNVVALHTCGKALGCVGALVTGPRSIRAFLINRARSFIYATAPSPVMAAVVRRALTIVRDEPWRRDRLAERVVLAGNALRSQCGLEPSGTHIMPVIVGQDATATTIAAAMQGHGYDIRAIRPPTVPEGTARLRITLTLDTHEATTESMLAILGGELRRAAGGSSSQADTPGPWPRHVPKSGDSPPASSSRRSQELGRSPERPPARFVVTGTGTGVGKTVFAAALTSALDADYWKPVQAGLDGGSDTQRVQALTGLPDERFHPEGYRLETPASPHHAAAIEGIEIDPGSLVPPQTCRPLVIEGAGGLMVPLTPRFLMIDLFGRWNAPVILVASTALGTINHSLLSLAALRARGIPLLGIAFVGEENASSEQIICSRGSARRLGRLPILPGLSRATLLAAFTTHFDPADFAPGPPPMDLP